MKRIVWAFRPRSSPQPTVHLFLVLEEGARPSPLAYCGYRRPLGEKQAPVKLGDQRFEGGTLRLCRNCARAAKVDATLNGEVVTITSSKLDWM